MAMLMINTLEMIDQRNQISLAASGKPQVGIFYIINEKIYWEGETPTLILNSEGGQKNYFRTHSHFFYTTIAKYILPDLLKPLISLLDRKNQRAWKYYPRGRVLCSENNQEFIVYCDKHITTNEAYKNMVKNEMNLPYSTVFETDGSHYRCHECVPMDFKV